MQRVGRTGREGWSEDIPFRGMSKCRHSIGMQRVAFPHYVHAITGASKEAGEDWLGLVTRASHWWGLERWVGGGWWGFVPGGFWQCWRLCYPHPHEQGPPRTGFFEEKQEHRLSCLIESIVESDDESDDESNGENCRRERRRELLTRATVPPKSDQRSYDPIYDHFSPPSVARNGRRWDHTNVDLISFKRVRNPQSPETRVFRANPTTMAFV